MTGSDVRPSHRSVTDVGDTSVLVKESCAKPNKFNITRLLVAVGGLIAGHICL